MARISLYSLLNIFTVCFFRSSNADICNTVDGFPVINTSYGAVKGVQCSSSWTNKSIFAFRGIPYAAAPISNLRFKDPVEVAAWNSTLDCTTDGPVCPQLQYPVSSTSEDCLRINVYSPEPYNLTGALFPVMVWVHGGAFLFGTGAYSMYGPDYLVAEGVVVVTLNYRLGAFGFLSFGTSDAPGNYGPKDIIMALKWVRNEIDNFGGDPNRVTLFGESAGSILVHYLYISPLTKGLFHTAIAESGCALGFATAFPAEATSFALQLADAVSCNSSAETATMLSCLRAANVSDIMEAGYQISTPYTAQVSGDIVVWKGVMDNETSDSPLFPALPQELLERGQVTTVPFILGTVRDEGSYMLNTPENEVMNLTSNLIYSIPESVQNRNTKNKLKHLTEEIKQFYFGDITPSHSNMTGYLHYYTDTLFAYHTALTARMLRNRTSVYLYHFTFDGTFKDSSTLQEEQEFNMSIIAHFEDVMYIFVCGFENQTTTEDSVEMRTWRRMVRMWTNFAKYGTPTVAQDEVLGDLVWSPVNGTLLRYLEIGNSLVMTERNYMEDSVRLWDSVLASTSSYVHIHNSVSLIVVTLIFMIFSTYFFQPGKPSHAMAL